MAVEKLACTISIVDNIVEIIPSKPIENNSIYEIVIKGLKPLPKQIYVGTNVFEVDTSELDVGAVVDKDYSEEADNTFIDDYKIRIITAMEPMYCNIIDVESLLEIADIPDEMILYNIREASKYADYVYQAMYNTRRHKDFKVKSKIDKDNLKYSNFPIFFLLLVSMSLINMSKSLRMLCSNFIRSISFKYIWFIIITPLNI